MENNIDLDIVKLTVFGPSGEQMRILTLFKRVGLCVICRC